MRFYLLGFISLVACRHHTLPIGSMPAYAENRPVLTREGYALAVEDGGRVQLVPHEGVCLRRVGDASFPNPTPLESAEPGSCRAVSIPKVERVTAGERLVIQGADQAVTVDPELVQAIRVHGPSLEPTDFAPNTGPNNVGLIVGGSFLMAIGVAGSIALFTAVANTDDGFGGDILKALFGTYGAIALGGGLAGGIPMVVIGARRVRLPQAEQPYAIVGELGSGLGLGWRFD